MFLSASILLRWQLLERFRVRHNKKKLGILFYPRRCFPSIDAFMGGTDSALGEYALWRITG
jgi:hypothetical protein